MEGMTGFVFELGKLLLKVELSKQDTKKIIQTNNTIVAEKVLVQKIGKFWNQQNKFDRPDGLVVLTTHRLIFLSKVKTLLTKTDFLSFPFEFIQNMEKIKIWLITPAIKFSVGDNVFIFTFLSSENLGQIVETIATAKKS
ncbi:MAG: PH domain-containing protein [Bacteroidota bacterium]